jgi:flagellar basal-body rod modification protein FlgD
MTVSAIDSASSGTSPASSLSMQDFLKVLLTQLTYQDPLKPMDDEQFMAQLAQFTTLGQTQQMNANIQQMLTNQAALQSVGLIGRTVDITTSSGPVTGTVTALSLAGSSPQLTITASDGSALPSVDLSQVTAIH